MKLHADAADRYAITSYGPDWIAVNGQRHTSSLLLSATEGPSPWSCERFAELSSEHFDALLRPLAEPPELIVLGSGSRLRFVRPALLRGLMERRIGVETMDTAAACRTYNILAGERRRVVAALLLGD